MTSEMLHAHMAKANAETALTKKFQEALTRSKRQKRQARKRDPEQERAELQADLEDGTAYRGRSEARRVGGERRSRGAPYQ